MEIIPLPCLQDNYAYLLADSDLGQAVVVDPSEAKPVIERLKEGGWDLVEIWNTHHHYDHVGGNKELVEVFSEVNVRAHASDKGRVPEQNVFLNDGESWECFGVKVQCIFNPGHTTGAISYYLESGQVFTGDTLFGAGCGRRFEGGAEEMHESLMKLAGLPDETLVYCGHEYTEANLRFAKAVEGENTQIDQRIAAVSKIRKEGGTTMGFSIAEEKASNVFLRCATADVRRAVEDYAEEELPEAWQVFGALRAWKDNF